MIKLNPCSTRITYALTSALVGVVLLAGCAHRPPDRDLLSDPELVPVAKGDFDHVYMQPGERLPRFDRVYIEDPEVSMNDYWLRDRRTEYSDRDLERIKREYSRYLHEALSEGLAEQTRIAFTDTPGEADVILRPTLRELNIYAPDLFTARQTRNYTREAGNGTFDLTLVDGATGEVLAQFIDHRETQSLEVLEEANRATNYRHFRRLMDRWTTNLADYLLIAGAVPARN